MVMPGNLFIDSPAWPLLRSGIVAVGTVNDAAPAVTDFNTNLIETTNNHYNGIILLFISGANTGQAHVIDIYTGATHNVSFAASDQWTDIPANGDMFILLPGTGDYLRKIYNFLAVITYAGQLQMKATTIDLNQAAGTYDLYTGTTQVVDLESFVIRMSGGAIGGALTSISIQTNDATPQIIIPVAQGAVANLTNEAQLSWNAGMAGPINIKVGQKIQLTIAGGAAGVARVCDVVAEYRAVVSGGVLV